MVVALGIDGHTCAAGTAGGCWSEGQGHRLEMQRERRYWLVRLAEPRRRGHGAAYVSDGGSCHRGCVIGCSDAQPVRKHELRTFGQSESREDRDADRGSRRDLCGRAE